MTVKDMLIDKTPKERANIKAIEISKYFNRTFKFNNNGKTITIDNVFVGYLDNLTPRIDLTSEIIWARVDVDGIYKNGDGWYGFLNPPIMCPTGAKIIKNIDGEDIEIDEMSENLIETAKIMILQAIGEY